MGSGTEKTWEIGELLDAQHGNAQDLGGLAELIHKKRRRDTVRRHRPIEGPAVPACPVDSDSLHLAPRHGCLIVDAI